MKTILVLLFVVPPFLALGLLADDTNRATPGAAPGTIYKYTELDTQPSLPKPRKGDRLFSYPNLRVTGPSRAMLEYPGIYERYRSPILAALAVVVGRDGKISGAKLLQTTEPEFGAEAVAKVNTWVVKPGELHGQPVSCATILVLRTEVIDGAGAGAFNSAAWFRQATEPPPQTAKP